MNIAQLANFYSPTSGGLRVAVDAFATGYRAAGHRCTTIVPGACDSATPGRHTIKSPLLSRSSGYRIMLRRKAIRALLDEIGPDRLEVHDKLLQPWLWTWSRAHGVPLVLVSHERLTDTLPVLLPLFPQRVTHAAAARITGKAGICCDALVTCSAFAAAEFAPIPVRVVPLGVDLPGFASRPAPHDGRVRLVVCSRLSAEKRVDIALDAARLLLRRGVDVNLRVVGTGPLADELSSRYAGPSIEFVGFVSRPDVAEELAAADVVLAPGPAETFGLAALEALASGTAIVAVAGCATAELIEGSPLAGRAASATPASFATAIHELLQVPGGLRSQAARARAANYTWDAAVAAMIDVHEGVGVAVTTSLARPDPGCWPVSR